MTSRINQIIIIDISENLFCSNQENISRMRKTTRKINEDEDYSDLF
jgi:hypothetical protein